MKLRKYKLSLCLLFTGIFMLKMLVLASPAFIGLFTKGDSGLISQLEQESKTDKEDPDKDAFKEKNFYSSNGFSYFEYQLLNVIYTVQNGLYKHRCPQLYHPTVPTPPPDC